MLMALLLSLAWVVMVFVLTMDPFQTALVLVVIAAVQWWVRR